MAKTKRSIARDTAKQADNLSQANIPDNLKTDPDIWYRILVLLHDLHNIATDRAAEARTLSTTDELYISAPYFTTEQASRIKTTLISPPRLSELPEFEALELAIEDDGPNETGTAIGAAQALSQAVPAETELVTIEEAITSSLRRFFDKRRASGDARPCGPHDMGPIYRAVFGISKEELRDEKFLRRLRRSGLGDSVRQGSSGGRVGKGRRKGPMKG